MFAVVPLRDCPHLKELNPENIPEGMLVSVESMQRVIVTDHHFISIPISPASHQYKIPLHRVRLRDRELGLSALLPGALRSLHQRARHAAQRGGGPRHGPQLQRPLGVVLQVRVLHRQSGAVRVQKPGPPGQIRRRRAGVVLRERPVPGRGQTQAWQDQGMIFVFVQDFGPDIYALFGQLSGNCLLQVSPLGPPILSGARNFC